MEKNEITGQWKCTVCDYHNKQKCNVFQHIQRRHCEYERIKCDFCDKSFKNPPSLNNHISVCHRYDNMVECKFC